MNKQTKEKISKALKGKMPKFIPNNKGIKRTAENKKQISDTLKRKGIKPPRPPREKLCRGSKHRWWKGGISPTNELLRKSPEYKLWRKSVFERDHYTCLICGEVGGVINAHHIRSWKDFPEERYEVNNGMTMCNSCHRLANKEFPLFVIKRKRGENGV